MVQIYSSRSICQRLYVTCSLITLFMIMVTLNYQSLPMVLHSASFEGKLISEDIDTQNCTHSLESNHDETVCPDDWTLSKNIWMMELNSSQTTLSAQNLCIIESYAAKMPTWCVRFLLVSESPFGNPFQKNCYEAELRATLGDKLKNIAIHNVEIEEILNGSGIAPSERSFLSSRYKLTHISDVLRVVLPYKYGGMHSDTDAILRRNLPQLESYLPFIARMPKSDEFRLYSSSFMAFPKGHPLLQMVVSKMFDGYYSFIYGSLLKIFYREISKYCINQCGVDPKTVKASTEEFKCCDVNILADRGMCFEHGEKVRNNCSFYHYTSTFCSFKHAKRTIELTADNYTLAEIARDSCPITVERKRYFYNQCTYE
ncbi:uncharacterized protein LOC134846289 isoform X2 [Symsagittifera roscoffensis]|uniref:uncharacterized protein LOC134846289 isoform X2 n=1 Tax=Symsagittifera roscoffensis TaxID=84072 RepID=UPI00307BCD9A